MRRMLRWTSSAAPVLLAAALLPLHDPATADSGGSSERRERSTDPHEAIGDPPAARHRLARSARPATIVTFGPHRHIQVNTDAGGGNLTGDAGNEPSIAVVTTLPSRIVIGWRQFDDTLSNFRQGGYAYSRDLGRTWAAGGVLEPGKRGSDPVLEADADGNIFYQSLRFAFPPERRYTSLVFRSGDGGKSWEPPAYGYGGDKPWMAIDRTSGPGRGHIYLTWSPYHTDPLFHYFTRSTNGGLTFERPITLDPRPQVATLTVGPDGTVYMAGIDFRASAPLPRRITVSWSTNAENAFVTPTFDTTTVYLGGDYVRGDSSFTHPNPHGFLGQVWIDTDHSSGPNAGNVYILASLDPPGPDPMDVMFARSSDGGLTWSAPVRVNDDASVIPAWQWFGTMAVAPNGRIDAVWNDTRNTGVVNRSELYHAYSTDGGVTWSANEQLSPSWNSWLGFPNQSKIGDYYDMVSDPVGAHVAWAATFNLEQDVYYTRIGDYDCNGNGVGDSLDLALGTSLDVDLSDIPDECEFPIRPHIYAEITGMGSMDGYEGYYQDFHVDGSLNESQFFYEEGGYVRWYARKEAGSLLWVPFPPGTYLVKAHSLAVGDSWTGYVNEPTIARVVREELVSKPGMSLSTFVIEHHAASDEEHEATMWFAENFGLVRYINHAEGWMGEFNSNYLAGGSGFLPSHLGNWWSSDPAVASIEPLHPAVGIALRVLPNPLRTSTDISFDLGSAAEVSLTVFDVSGARVRTLHSGHLPAGTHRAAWSGRDAAGRALRTGVYFLRLAAGASAVTQKMVLLH